MSLVYQRFRHFISGVVWFISGSALLSAMFSGLSAILALLSAISSGLSAILALLSAMFCFISDHHLFLLK
ncbi:hypothetical protein [Lysinibacillus xylanilyticus]|uniref:hypothetical protein n=1 Tax=Lysinibacillus xylanilyticus TaxID=582475 RepID=UPI003D058749